MMTLTTEDLKFRDTVKDFEVENIHEYFGISRDVDIMTSGELDIEYSIFPYFRRYGIESFSIDIISVYGAIEWSIWEDQLSIEDLAKVLNMKGYYLMDSTIVGTIEFNSYDGWTIEHELEFTKDGGIQISGLQIDFALKKIMVS